MCFLEGEVFHNFPQMFYDRDIFNSYFIWSVVLTGVIGFGLNFASLWCVSSTSATTYAIVGTLNKIPITILGFLLFDTKLTSQGIGFVVLATLGGLLYGYAKAPK
jgi:GDP-mannose transporter